MTLPNEPYTNRKGLTMITFTKSNLDFLIAFWYWWDDTFVDHQTIPRPWYAFWLPRYIVLCDDGCLELVTAEWFAKEANDVWLTMATIDRIAFLGFHQAQEANDVKWQMRRQRRIEAEKLKTPA